MATLARGIINGRDNDNDADQSATVPKNLSSTVETQIRAEKLCQSGSKPETRETGSTRLSHSHTHSNKHKLKFAIKNANMFSCIPRTLMRWLRCGIMRMQICGIGAKCAAHLPPVKIPVSLRFIEPRRRHRHRRRRRCRQSHATGRPSSSHRANSSHMHTCLILRYLRTLPRYSIYIFSNASLPLLLLLHTSARCKQR